jgi:hypothetical protein
MNWSDWISQLALSLLAAAGASWITVQLSLGRFYKEKWWEKRFEAYARIIRALHELHRVMREEHVKIKTPHHASKYPILTHERLMEPLASIHEAIDVGELLISTRMVSLLRSFSEDLGKTGELGLGALDASTRLMEKTMPEAVAIARADLQLAPFLVKLKLS